MPRVFLVIVLACAITFVPALGNAADAPDFTLPDLDGKNVSLSGFKGKVVLLNFWATNCAPCKAEMPSLNSLYLQLRDRGLVVLAISTDAVEKPVRSYISEKKFAFPVLLDNDKEVYFDTYGLLGLPVTVIIDRKGSIVEKVIGERQWDSSQMKDKILRLLNGQ